MVHRLVAVYALSLAGPLQAQEDAHRVLLPKEAFKALQKDADKAFSLSRNFDFALQLTAPDERILLHLPKRGFRHLAALLDTELSLASSALGIFYSATKFRSGSQEEDIADTLLGEAVARRAFAGRYACFRLIRELAPSPEAMHFEQQAKELGEKIAVKADAPTESQLLETLESIRKLFDQLRDLPKMTPEEFARERAESAVLAPSEYLDGSVQLPPWLGNGWPFLPRDDYFGLLLSIKKGWPYQQLERQSQWDHEDYLVAYSERSGPDDYQRFQMVVNRHGSIFEACQAYSGSHFGPDSYESKLPPAELGALEGFLTKLPPSNASGDEVHFIVSFMKGGKWVTQTYDSLPEEAPFRSLLERMINQSQRYWTAESDSTAEPVKEPEFLVPKP